MIVANVILISERENIFRSYFTCFERFSFKLFLFKEPTGQPIIPKPRRVVSFSARFRLTILYFPRCGVHLKPAQTELQSLVDLCRRRSSHRRNFWRFLLDFMLSNFVFPQIFANAFFPVWTVLRFSALRFVF